MSKAYSNKRGDDEDRFDNILTGENGDDEDQNTSSAPRVVGPKVALKFLVSNNLAGALIGRGGSGMTVLQTETGAKIKVSQNTDVYPGTQDRVVLVTGAESTVIFASSLIVDKSLEIEPGRTDPTSVTVKILIPSAASGLMIGRGGAHIKSLSDESGARVRLSPKEAGVLTMERVMTITGPAEACTKCISLVVGKLLEDATVGTYHNMSTSYTRALPIFQMSNGYEGSGGGIAGSETVSASTTITMAIPDSVIGNVLGKKGAGITEIQALSGAKVKISPRGEYIAGTTNRSVTITGATQSAQMAQFFINNKLQAAQTQRSNRNES